MKRMYKKNLSLAIALTIASSVAPYAMVSRTIYAFSFFIVLNLPVKVNVKRKIHNDFKKRTSP